MDLEFLGSELFLFVFFLRLIFDYVPFFSVDLEFLGSELFLFVFFLRLIFDYVPFFSVDLEFLGSELFLFVFFLRLIFDYVPFFSVDLEFLGSELFLFVFFFASFLITCLGVTKKETKCNLNMPKFEQKGNQMQSKQKMKPVPNARQI